MKSVKYVFFIHAYPLETLGGYKLYPADAFYIMAEHLSAIKARHPRKMQVFYTDSEAAKRASQALLSAFGEAPKGVTNSMNLPELEGMVLDDTEFLIVVSELPQLTDLMNPFCKSIAILPPNVTRQEFPNGGMVEVAVEGGRANLFTGKKKP